MNVVALVTCALLLGLAPVANGATLVARSALDPSVSGDAVAFARQAGSVVVRPSSGPDVVFPNASQPALSGRYLAFVDDQGIRVVRWRDGTEVARVAGTNVSRPALHWPNLAFVRRGADVERIIVRNLVSGRCGSTPSRWRRASISGARPCVSGRLAWHMVTRRGSRILVRNLASAPPANGRPHRDRPAQRPFALREEDHLGRCPLRSHLPSPREARLEASGRTLARLEGRSRSYWTTSLSGTSAYMTRWTLASGAAAIYKTGS